MVLLERALRNGSTVSEQNRILNRAQKNARWIRFLTFDPLPAGEGMSLTLKVFVD
jgi:hypothetical protein